MKVKAQIQKIVGGMEGTDVSKTTKAKMTSLSFFLFFNFQFILKEGVKHWT